MRDVLATTDGELRMGPGTLYGAVKRMLAAGLIEESDERPDPALDDERRRYYRLTDIGQRLVTAESSDRAGDGVNFDFARAFQLPLDSSALWRCEARAHPPRGGATAARRSADLSPLQGA